MAHYAGANSYINIPNKEPQQLIIFWVPEVCFKAYRLDSKHIK